MIQIAGIDTAQFKSVCSSVDKLDKLPWTEVRKELVERKQVSEEAADRLSTMVLQKGEPFEMLKRLQEQGQFKGNKLGEETLEEMKVLFTYLKQMKGIERVVFDLSLARGLDYYTGLIQETVLEGANVGSISGGGRYDKLVGMFASQDIPCVGASIGIERIFSILEAKLMKQSQFRDNPSECIVATIPSQEIDMNEHRFKVLDLLWSNGIKCDLIGKLNWNLGKQLKYANDNRIPYAVVIGQEEVNAGVVKLKDLNGKKEDTMKLEDLVKSLQEKLR